MTTIAFFGHDGTDSAVRRRIGSLGADGFEVCGYTMRRSDEVVDEFENIDLGRTYDGAFIQRIRQVFRGARIAATPQNQLSSANVIYARNLDMLACAFLAKRYAKLNTRVIYECLDVHRLLVRRGPIGMALRGLERFLLKRTIGLIVSSPAFLNHYFERYHKDLYTAALVENRLTPAALDNRPARDAAPINPSAPLRIGWVGILRCQRSLDLLCGLADRFEGEIEIKLHGKPARTEIPVFEPVIERRLNMTYFGPYRAPEDLPEIYTGLDLVWAGDFMEAGFNSVWLLPNRIYEGGFYQTPPICVSGTQTAAWVSDKQAGFCLAEPLETTLANLIEQLIADRSAIDVRHDRLRALPEEVFIQPKGMLARIIDGFLKPGGET